MAPIRLAALAVLTSWFAGCAASNSALGQNAVIPGPAPLNGSISRSQKPEAPQLVGSPVHLTTFEAATVPPARPEDGQVAVQIRAHVNSLPIFDEEIRAAAYPSLVETLGLPEPERSARQAIIFRRELEAIIERELILADAATRLSKSGPQFMERLKAAASKEFDKTLRALKKRTGCKTDEELKEFLRAHGESLETMRREVERGFMAREYLQSRVYPAVERIGHQQIQDYYVQHPAEFQIDDAVSWQDLFIDASKYPTRMAARRMAEQLAARFRLGAPLETLLPYDNGDASYRHGEGLGRHRGEIRPAEAEAALFQLRDGEVGPIIEIPTGFHVFRLVHREYAGRRPLDEKTQAEIRKKLRAQAAQQEAQRLLDELKANASIEIAGTNP